MDDTDLLQIKIEKAKAQLSEETRSAIAAVPWQAHILKMRETKGYTFEQLGDLETETELLLSGLLSPESYPKELEKRMGITKAQANDLVKEMNQEVFSKIKEELIKTTERKASLKTEEGLPEAQTLVMNEKDVLTSAGIEILPTGAENRQAPAAISAKQPFVLNKPEPHPIVAEKLSGPVVAKTVTTEHSLGNISSGAAVKPAPKIDPYREIPE